MDDINWEMMMMMMMSGKAVSDAISPPVGVLVQQENNVNINDINHDYDQLNDQAVELGDDLDRPSEENNGTSSRVMTSEGDDQGRMRRYSRNRNTRAMKQPNLVSCCQPRTPRVPACFPSVTTF